MKVVVVSPHPDDETLGAGGTLHRLKAEGNEIYWLNVTNVCSSDRWTGDFTEKRMQQIKNIVNIYQFNQVFDLNLPPAELGDLKDGFLINKISNVFNEIKPHTVILPDRNDAHTDHKYVFDAAMSCTKIFRYPFIKRILTMEILSETGFGNPYEFFLPNYYVDVTDYMELKIKSLECYDTELQMPPFPRSIDAVRAQALLRGGEAGCMYAEAFKIVKWIE